MTIVTVGIYFAKNLFSVHGIDESGKPALVRPDVARVKLIELIAKLPPCLIGLEGPLQAKQPRMTVCSFAVHMPCTEQATSDFRQ